MLVGTFPTKNLVEVEKSYNGKLSTSCTSTVLLHSGTFVCFKGSWRWYACRLTEVSVFAEFPNGHGIPP